MGIRRKIVMVTDEVKEQLEKEYNEKMNAWFVPTDEEIPNGWEKLEVPNKEPIYRDAEGNKYHKTSFGFVEIM